jgi:hypothetical protein
MRTGPLALLPFAVSLLIIGAAGGGQAQTLPCDAAPKAREALRNLPEATGDAQADRARRLEALRALLQRFPRDPFVHERYQDTAISTTKDRDSVIAEYRALAETHAGDALYQYLAARTQVGANTKEVIPKLEAVAAAMPPARLALVRIYQASAFKDLAKAREQLELFQGSCPASFRDASYLRSLEPSEFLSQRTASLRSRLRAAGKEPTALVTYGTLWNLEFRVRPTTEHDALRKRIAEDLRRLRGIDPGRNQSYYSMLQQGYKLVNDVEGAKWASGQLRTLFPRSAYSVVREQWRAAHPAPATSDSGQRRAYDEAFLQASAEWAREWPDQTVLWFERVGAMGRVDGVPATEVEAAGDGLLKAVEKNPGQMSFFSPIGGNSFALMVAHLYAAKGVRLDRLSALIEQGIPELEGGGRVGLDSDLYPLPSGAEDSNREYGRWHGNLTIADIWIKAKDRERAHQALQTVLKLVEQSKPKGDVDLKDSAQAGKQRTYVTRYGEYSQRMGDLAAFEGRKADAMTFYQNALLARPTPPASGAKDELAEKARGVWKELGGTNEGWVAWFNRRDVFGGALPDAGAARWTKMEKTLPDFELPDLAGVKWKLASIKGKTTLINVWAMT